MNVCESLTASARLFPDQDAMVFQGSHISYRQLDSLSQSACQVLQSKGLNPGDRVAIQIGNCPAFAVWYYAALRGGAIVVSISTRLADAERKFMVEDSGATILVSDQILGERSGLPEDCLEVTPDGRQVDGRDLELTESTSEWYLAEPNEPALILYTSGTTGFPKGAVLSHANVRSNVAAFNHLCNMRPRDRVLLAVPLFHCFGQNAILNSVLNVGGTLILQERFDLNESKRLIRDYQVNQLYGVPMMFELLHGSCNADDLASVEYYFSAAAPLPLATSKRWREKFGLPIHEGYGLTETSPFASYNHRDRYIAGSIGTPIDAVEMQIVDPESGNSCEVDQLGEIAIRGPNVMLGYWNRKQETAEAIRDGWFYSGDIGRQDELGYFYIVDRVKDMIAVGGMKVFPAEVERVLRAQDGVADVAVVGIEEPILGEQVIGFVVPEPKKTPSLDARQLIEESKQELGGFKVPRRIFLVSDLPRNPSGKILKNKLRELAREKVATGEGDKRSGETTSKPVASSAEAAVNANPYGEVDPPVDAFPANAGLPHEGTPQRLLKPGLQERIDKVHPGRKLAVIGDALSELVQLLTGADQLPDPDQTFLDMGMDSLMLVELGTQLQAELDPDQPLPPTLLFDHPRIEDLSRFVFDQTTIEREPTDSSVTNGLSERAGTESQSPSKPESIQQEKIKQEIEELSEEEALQQLMKELE